MFTKCTSRKNRTFFDFYHKNRIIKANSLNIGGCSSVGRAPDCGSGCRGFDPHHSPQIM